MKNRWFIIYTMFVFGFISNYAQEKMYTQIYDSVRQQTIYEGLLTTPKDKGFHKKNFFFSELPEEPYFSDIKIYKPLLKNLLEANKNPTISMVIVGGIWWCIDTRNILSKLVVYTDSSHFYKITCMGIDRKKQSHSYDLVNQYHVDRVPTLIILKNNQEIGRVVEYGKKGNWEKELSDILSKSIK